MSQTDLRAVQSWLKFAWRSSFLLVVLCISAPVSAYQPVDEGLEWKVQRAEVVVIGRVRSVPLVAGKYPDRFITVDVVSVLKGSPKKVLNVQTAPYPEDTFECCKPAGTYLFFLWRRGKYGAYESVNGRFGFYPMEAP